MQKVTGSIPVSSTTKLQVRGLEFLTLWFEDRLVDARRLAASGGLLVP
jgi:hypothetical protein